MTSSGSHWSCRCENPIHLTRYSNVAPWPFAPACAPPPPDPSEAPGVPLRLALPAGGGKDPPLCTSLAPRMSSTCRPAALRVSAEAAGESPPPRPPIFWSESDASGIARSTFATAPPARKMLLCAERISVEDPGASLFPCSPEPSPARSSDAVAVRAPPPPREPDARGRAAARDPSPPPWCPAPRGGICGSAAPDPAPAPTPMPMPTPRISPPRVSPAADFPGVPE